MRVLSRQHLLWLLLFCVAALFVFITARSGLNSPRHWVNHVEISGVPESKQLSVEKAVKPLLNHNVAAINLKQISNALLAFPWVSNVSVHRVWPNELDLDIDPQQLVASWNSRFVLNRYGEAFQLTKKLQDKPALFGPQGEAVEALGMAQQLQTVLSSVDLKITQVHLGPDGDWWIKTKNGMKIQLGSKHILTRTQRFVTVYPKVFNKRGSANGRYVDLRYTHGMAVSKG